MTPADRSTPSRTLVRDLLGLPDRRSSLCPAGSAVIPPLLFPGPISFGPEPWPAAAVDSARPSPTPAIPGATETLRRPPAPVASPAARKDTPASDMSPPTPSTPKTTGQEQPEIVPIVPATGKATAPMEKPLIRSRQVPVRPATKTRPETADPVARIGITKVGPDAPFSPAAQPGAESARPAPVAMPPERPGDRAIVPGMGRQTTTMPAAMPRPRQVPARPDPAARPETDSPVVRLRVPATTADTQPSAAAPPAAAPPVVPPRTVTSGTERAATSTLRHANTPTAQGEPPATPPVAPAAGVMELRRSFHERMRSQGTVRQVTQNHEEHREKPPETARPEEQGPSPLPLQQVVVIRQTAAPAGPDRPHAFWERSYLTRWTGRILG